MKVTTFIVNFSVISFISFLVSIIVTYLYSLITDGTGSIDWLVSIRNGLTFGIILPLVQSKILTKSK